MKFTGLLVAICLGLAGCAAPMRMPGLPPASALAAPDETPLWSQLVAPAEAAAGRSGFDFLECGLDAYQLRLTAIEAATRSIDIQYYIWDLDASGRAISEALLRAAARGVRVRALVDGFHIHDGAAPLQRIARHPNVEVRLHNPFRSSFRPNGLRYAELVFDFARLNQRMHNKIVAVDNTLAIVGGRNVSDAYFGLDPARYFLDRDVVVAGPLTADISASFDAFWNDPQAVPVGDFAVADADPAVDAAALWADAPPLDPASFPLPRRIEGAALAARLDAIRDSLLWAEGLVSLTAPGPVFAAQAPAPGSGIEARLLALLAAAESEVVIQTPYMMLTEARSAAFAAARARGVTLTLHTNSLASTDSSIVHYGYARDRLELARLGVELHEMKERPRPCPGAAALGLAPEKTTLHPKTVVFDRRWVLVGSFNLDHRSILYNSEIAILIDSPAVAARVLEAMARDMAPESNWRVALEAPARLVWIDNGQDPPLRHDSEPHTGVLQQVLAWIGYFLPIDHLL
ncbi:phospholipase D family protein [uncultured Parvibaculum sp.]|uniref:phospholipase D family protein n=1 Tax=uncultured Parvibaculum sp. TaxID=291828 RepID=UPI0030D7A4F1|tara:strand:- start:127068 stop:128618 length:1551 start_codon:yes stop_codon:yes gene_type:complete